MNEIQTGSKKKEHPKNPILTAASQRRRLTDSSSEHFSSSSSSTSGHLSKSNSSSSASSRNSNDNNRKNVIHIEIINHYDECRFAKHASPSTNAITQQNLKNLSDCCQRPYLTDDSKLRIVDNEVQLNGGNIQEAADFCSQNMQKFRYKKKLTSGHLMNVSKKLNHVTLDNYKRNKSASGNLSLNSAMSNIKLDQPAYRYEQFSRNLNASLSSIYDNAPETQDLYENDSETDVMGLNSSVNLEKSFRSSISSDRESTSSYGNLKCHCLGDNSIKPNEDATSGESSSSKSQSKVNVKDLISKFENRNESIVLC